jgi:hypothetical protein
MLQEILRHAWAAGSWAMSPLIRLIGLFLMAERIAMPVADGAEAPSAKPGYRVISADLATGPSVGLVIPAEDEARNQPHVLASIPSWADEIVLADGDSVDDTAAMVTLLRPDVKIVTQKGHGKEDDLLTGLPTVSQGDHRDAPRSRVHRRRLVSGPAARDHLMPEAHQSIRASVVVCVYTEKRLSQIRAALDSIARQTMPSWR